MKPVSGQEVEAGRLLSVPSMNQYTNFFHNLEIFVLVRSKTAILCLTAMHVRCNCFSDVIFHQKRNLLVGL